MDINNVFPSKYLKAEDLQGRDVTVTISNALMEKLGDDNRLVLYFQGKNKGMVCNKTNANTIAQLYGPNTDNWMGRTIMLYAAWVDFQGKQTQGLRVRPPSGQTMAQHNIGQQAQAPLQQGNQMQQGNARGGTDVLDDEIPF